MPKSHKRVSISLATAIVALSLAGGAYAQAPTPEASATPPTLDTNEDGKADGWDRDANGTPDAWDVNGDAKPDVFDNDGDGKPDDKTDKAKVEPKR